MARLFDDAASQSLDVDATPVTAAPFTLAAWIRSDDAAIIQGIVFVGDKNVGTQFWSVEAVGTSPGDPIRFRVRSGATIVTVLTTTGYSVDTWHHVCAVESASNSRAVYIDGGSKATDTTNISPTGADRISVGRLGDSTPSDYFSGRIAWPAIWGVALNDDEVNGLARGIPPTRIRPQNLRSCWPLYGTASPEVNIWRDGVTYNLTVTGPTQADGPPRVGFPWPGVAGWRGAFAAAAVAVAPAVTPGDAWAGSVQRRRRSHKHF